MPMPRIFAFAALAIALAGCAAQQSALEDEIEPWEQARVVGEAESCVSLTRIRDTIVRDDRTIDFEMVGGETYRNTLPAPCPGLRAERSFAYETSLSRLCSTDIITVLRQPISAGANGPRCGLGAFVPVELPNG
ncbi:MAG: hypothetical protein ABR601_02635 [Parasphingopyxis sp.]|nr:hypothetical protein [Sphingomonadales bacterium]